MSCMSTVGRILGLEEHLELSIWFSIYLHALSSVKYVSWSNIFDLYSGWRLLGLC
jgi:hypothetical protein